MSFSKDFYRLSFASRLELLNDDPSILERLEFNSDFFGALLKHEEVYTFIKYMVNIPKGFMLEMVRKFPHHCLRVWQHHTEDIVLEALKADPTSFCCTHLSTPEVLTTAVKLDPENISLIESPSLELCELALNLDRESYKHLYDLDLPEVLELEYRTRVDLDRDIDQEQIEEMLDLGEISYSRLASKYKSYKLDAKYGDKDIFIEDYEF